MKGLTWQKTTTGVWHSKVGEPSSLSPLAWMKQEPKHEALKRLGDAELPFDLEEVRLDHVGKMLVLSFPLTESEAIYGTGSAVHAVESAGKNQIPPGEQRP